MNVIRTLRQDNWAAVLNKPSGYFLLSFLGLFLSMVVIRWGATAGVGIIIFTVAVPFTLAVMAFPVFGLVTLIVSAYLIMWLNRMLLTFPAGTLMDGLEVLLFTGFIIKHKYDRTWEFLKSPITVIIVIWLIYNVLQVINPSAESRLAWLYTIRTVALTGLTYFLFMYHVTTVQTIRLIIKTWLALSAFAAIYGIFQEMHGFLPFEKAWLETAESNAGLYFIAGVWRRFSIFSDPVAAAYNMVVASMLSIVLMVAVKPILKKLLLFGLTCIFLMSMLYTGIRGSFILVPAGIAMYFLLRMNARIFIITMISAVCFLAFLKMPLQNTALYRVQTAFFPKYDPSFKVRKYNQKRIQPYIQMHPLGGGLGATGTWGQRFSKGSYLASFPPDSGYMRVAVETGWVGLLLICTLFFVLLYQGITNYFIIQDPELKSYCLAMVLIVFVLSIGNYPQEALVQYPINIFFFLVAALISITKKLDIQLQQQALIKTI